MSLCRCQFNCMASFHYETKRCRAVEVGGPLAWIRSFLTLNVSESGWTTLLSNAETSLERPSGLWLLDNAFMGRNLGTKGSAFDLQKSSRVLFRDAGPRQGSRLLYSKFSSVAGYPIIPVLQSGKLLLNYTKSFTWSFWIKTGNAISFVSILEGKNFAKSGYAYSIKFYSHHRQLYMFGKELVRTAVNATGRLDWRHVAVVQNGSDYEFYLNGYPWPILSKRNYAPALPDEILLGHRTNSHRLSGNMACLTMFERALNLTEIRELMRVCP